ncbi:MAG: ABC transporter permease subunit [Clostridia bacterium]|nr:ABC transporter permease subunit [Clostridia bacterium]
MIAIFKRDFKALYKTPVGYVFSGTLLLLIYVLFYIFNIYSVQTADISVVMGNIIYWLFLPIPILTMRLMTEEYRQQTDQLLLTAPVSCISIVLGKFLAGMMAILITIVMSFAIPVIIMMFGELQGWTLFGNYIALIAASSAFLSIALFISSLTENLLVSIISNWGVFIALIYLDDLASLTATPFIETLANNLSPFMRFQGFAVGQFSLGDFVYYISAAALFLFLASRVLEKKRYS